MPVKCNHGMSEMMAAITNPPLTGEYVGPTSDPGRDSSPEHLWALDQMQQEEWREAEEQWEISLYERDYNVQMECDEAFDEGAWDDQDLWAMDHI